MNSWFLMDKIHLDVSLWKTLYQEDICWLIALLYSSMSCQQLTWYESLLKWTYAVPSLMEFGLSVLTAQFMIVVWVKAPNELFECWYKEIVVKDIQIYTGTIHIIHVHDHFIIFFLDLCARNSVASNIGWCLNLLLLGHIAWQKIVWNVIWPPSTQRIVKISYLNMKVSFEIH